jgi:hypothetical protein
MKVPSPTEGRTRPTPQGMDYLRAATPDFGGLVSGLNSLGASIEAKTTASKAERDKLTQYNAQIAFNDFETGTQGLVDGLKKSADPAAANFPEVVGTEFTNYENRFIESLPPDLQDMYRVKTSEKRQTVLKDARDFDLEQRGAYYKQGIDKAGDQAQIAVEADKNSLETNKARVREIIESADLSLTQRAEMLRLNDEQLEGIAYRKEVEDHKVKTQGASSELAKAIKWAAGELGGDPIDVATLFSFETGGTFSTSIKGGAGGKYVGLFQAGPNEQAEFGVRAGQSYQEQAEAFVRYMKKRGYKPGMSFLDMYSTVNAGAPGRHNARDTSVGGTPGTVADKVNNQMAGHRKNATALFGGTYEVPDELDSDPRYSNVSYEDRIALRKAADSNASSILTAMQNERKAQQAGFINNFKLKVLDGAYGQKELDEARQYGLVDDFEDIKMMQGMIDKRNEDGQDLRDVQAKFDKGLMWSFLDEKDNKIANTWFNEVNKGALEKGDAGYFDNILLPFTRVTKMIPKDAINKLDAMSRQQSPTALFALDALSKLHNAEPDAYERQVPEATQKNVDFWEARKNAGYDQKATLDLIGGRMTLEQRNAREVFGKQADAFFNDPANVGYFDKVLEAFSPDTSMPFDPTAQAPVWGSARLGMESDWKTIYKENLILAQGDHAIAESMTNKQVGRTWGTTDFGGRFTLMKWPPSKVGYNESNGKWLEDQARGELHIPPNQSMQLISDDQTQADFAKGKPASYLVAIQTPEGWQLATNANGDIIRQHFIKTAEIKLNEDENFGLEQQKFEVKQSFLRYTEAAAHSQATGIPIPQDIVDDYNNQRAAVDKREDELAKKRQGPIDNSPEKVRPEGPLVLNLLREQHKRQVVVPGVDVKTLEGYPPPALGMISAGNIPIAGSVKDVYLLKIPEDGGFVIVPRFGTEKEALHKYNTTPDHLGIFADENSANAYIKSLKGKR